MAIREKSNALFSQKYYCYEITAQCFTQNIMSFARIRIIIKCSARSCLFYLVNDEPRLFDTNVTRALINYHANINNANIYVESSNILLSTSR